MFFNEVAEPEEGKNRLHLDLQTPQREQEVARLVALGASVRTVHPEWTVLADPEGNEFCVRGDADLYG